MRVSNASYNWLITRIYTIEIIILIYPQKNAILYLIYGLK